jgi:hypothetical protein
MKPLTPGAYEHLKASAYRYVSIVDFRNTDSNITLVIRPFKTMNDADTRLSIMGIEDSLISGAVHGHNSAFSIEYVLQP